MKRILPFLLLPFLFTSCFHKDVMTDRADDVETVFIYTGTEGKFIITKEEIFQATSKESNGGFTQISGNAEYRLTAYDFATGELTGRVDMGDGQEKSCIIMGITPGKIWVYSIDEELGLHCRNPKTLEVISDEKALTASGPLKGFAFARPEWMKLNQHYGWKAENGMLMLTDMQGFHYYYDPGKNTLTKTEDEIPDYNWAKSNLGSTGYFGEDNYVSLRGDGRQKLLYKYEDSTGKYSYLTGELILDCNPMNDVKRKKAYTDSLDRQLASWNDSLKSFQAKYPGLGEEITRDMRNNYELYRMSWKQDEIKRKIDDVGRDRKEADGEHFNLFNNPLLTDASGNFFVIYATDVSDTSRMQLACQKLKGKQFTENWSIRLSDFYRDPDKADSKGAFETVFSDGNPEFDFQWFGIEGDKLILISQLQMICVDTASGKIVWQHPL